ncbi:hypothetical protein FB45DRAFT_864586 [Roridomyces roridus]|uniref:Uncharacterized protein n=1 Tax=Roridomyces roridus TaxID=1738132 RepID=A0AAD7C1L8_9AGAR|nr:hypothetical protein FB45DRAFT_864586 [Roridomyces roridus]
MKNSQVCLTEPIPIGTVCAYTPAECSESGEVSLIGDFDPARPDVGLGTGVGCGGVECSLEEVDHTPGKSRLLKDRGEMLESEQIERSGVQYGCVLLESFLAIDAPRSKATNCNSPRKD